MQAIAIDSTGGPEVLVPHDLPVPEPKAGEALVRIEAIGVNFIDVYFRKGTYPIPHFPFVPGNEAAGVVERVGPGVTRFAPGDRVAYATWPGSYASHASVPVDRLVALPDGVTSRDAAALLLQGMTAHYLCASTFPLTAGQTALVHAGAGGVGLLLTQLAKARGATVITTVSTAEKAALSKAAGADHTIDYTREDFGAEVRRLTNGRGADVAYDSVGKTTWEASLGALRPRGYLVLFGASSGPVPPIEPLLLQRKGSLFLTRPTLADYAATVAELEWRAGEVFAAVLAGTLALRVEHTYPLVDARRAHEDLESRATTGKLLLLP